MNNKLFGLTVLHTDHELLIASSDYTGGLLRKLDDKLLDLGRIIIDINNGVFTLTIEDKTN